MRFVSCLSVTSATGGRRAPSKLTGLAAPLNSYFLCLASERCTDLTVTVKAATHFKREPPCLSIRKTRLLSQTPRETP